LCLNLLVVNSLDSKFEFGSIAEVSAYIDSTIGASAYLIADLVDFGDIAEDDLVDLGFIEVGSEFREKLVLDGLDLRPVFGTEALEGVGGEGAHLGT
jgi:hypothetical protein